MRAKRLNNPRAQNRAATGGQGGWRTFAAGRPFAPPLAGHVGCSRNEFAGLRGGRAASRVGWKGRPRLAPGVKPCHDPGLCRTLRTDEQDLAAFGNYSPARPKKRRVGRMPGQPGRR